MDGAVLVGLAPENTGRAGGPCGVADRKMSTPTRPLRCSPGALKADPAKKQALYNQIVVYGI